MESSRARCLTGQPARLTPAAWKKVISPNDFASTSQLAATLLAFTGRYNQTARPFHWKYAAADLTRLLDRIGAHDQPAQEPAALPQAA